MNEPGEGQPGIKQGIKKPVIKNHKGPEMGRREFLGRAKNWAAGATLASGLGMGGIFIDGVLNPDPLKDKHPEEKKVPAEHNSTGPRSKQTLEELGVTLVDERELPETITMTSEELAKVKNDLFEEFFPGCSPEKKKAWRSAIINYQQPQREKGRIGIGTLETKTQMGDLLRKEMVDDSGERVKFESLLQEIALKYGINPNVLKGMIFIESGGDIHAYNEKSGATGIGQFVEKTAKDPRIGLIDENGNDYRKDPFKSIEAMGKYMGILMRSFGENTGFAVWTYHAGEGNVINALTAYYAEIDPSVTSFEQIQDKLAKKELNVIDFMRHPIVTKFIKEHDMGDDTENYATKALAGAEYFIQKPLGVPTPPVAV